MFEDQTCSLEIEKRLYAEMQQVRAPLRVDLCELVHTEMNKAHMSSSQLYAAWKQEAVAVSTFGWLIPASCGHFIFRLCMFLPSRLHLEENCKVRNGCSAIRIAPLLSGVTLQPEDGEGKRGCSSSFRSGTAFSRLGVYTCSSF